MKRWILTLLTGAVLLAGCGKPGPKPLTVSLFSDIDGVRIMSEHLRRFEAQSGLKVEPVYIPYANYNDKLVTQISAGQAPDLIWVDVDKFITLRALGAFIALDDFAAKDGLDLKGYWPMELARFSAEGKLWAVPMDIAPTACVFYNRQAFAEAGMKDPRPDWTWDEFLAACRKLVKRDAAGKVTRWAFHDNYGPDLPGILYSNGASLVDDEAKPSRCVIDSPRAIQAAQFLADLSLKHQVSPPPGAKNNVLALGQDEFISGRLAMVRTGIWITPALRQIKDFEWDIAPFPSGPGAGRGKGRWGSGGSGYAISANCRRPQDAFKLLKFLTSAESQKSYAATGFVQPSLMSLARSPVFLDSAPPRNKAWLNEAVKRAVFNPAHPRWAEAEQSILSSAYTELMSGRASAAQVLPEAAARVNALLFSGKNP